MIILIQTIVSWAVRDRAFFVDLLINLLARATDEELYMVSNYCGNRIWRDHDS
jgi:hypothetical protein